MSVFCLAIDLCAKLVYCLFRTEVRGMKINVKLWSIGPGIISLTFNQAEGIFPIARSHLKMEKYDPEKIEKFVSPERIKKISEILHSNGAERFVLCQKTLHVWISMTVTRIREIIREACPDDIIYITDNLDKHRRFKVKIIRHSDGLLVIFPRAKSAGFCPIVIVSGRTLGWGRGPDGRVMSSVVNKFMECLGEQGATINPGQTIMWIRGGLSAERVGEILESIYSRGWLDIQIF